MKSKDDVDFIKYLDNHYQGLGTKLEKLLDKSTSERRELDLKIAEYLRKHLGLKENDRRK